MDRQTFPCPHCSFPLPTWATGNCAKCRRPLQQPPVTGPPLAPGPPPAGFAAFTPYQVPAPAPATLQAYSWAPAPPLPKRRVLPMVVGVLSATFGALFVLGVGVAMFERQKAVDSPARSLVQEPCAQYRELSIRLASQPSTDLAQQVIRWLGANVATFDQAAAADPGLAEAAGAVRDLNAIFADPARLARTSDAEMDTVEAPLLKACTIGAGRA